MATRPNALCLLAAAGLALGAGCFRAPFMPPQGGVFTSLKAPLQTDFRSGGVACDSAVGSSSSYYVYVPFTSVLSVAWAECAVQQAAANGGLSAVEYADYEYLQVLGVFAKMTVHAYGPRQATGLPAPAPAPAPVADQP